MNINRDFEQGHFNISPFHIWPKYLICFLRESKISNSEFWSDVFLEYSYAWHRTEWWTLSLTGANRGSWNPPSYVYILMLSLIKSHNMKTYAMKTSEEICAQAWASCVDFMINLHDKMVEVALIWGKMDGGATVLAWSFMNISVPFFMKNNDFMFNIFVKWYEPGSQGFLK